MSAPPRRRPVRALTATGLAVDVLVVGVDLLTPGFEVPIAPLVIAPLLPATAGLLRATVSLAILSSLIAVGLLISRDHLGETDELIRLASGGVIVGLAIIGTRLRRRVDELAQALDTLPDAVTIQAGEGLVLYGNRAAARLSGEPDGVSPEAAAAYLRRMEVTIDGGEPLDPARMPAQRLIAGETDVKPVVVRSRDPETGIVQWTRVQASPLRNAEGHVRSAVNVIEDITAVKRAEQRSAFLARAAALLGSSLEPEVTLQRAAQLVVPVHADWCSIDLLHHGRGLELAALAHVDPVKVAVGHELRRRYPVDVDRQDGVGAVLRTGKPQLYREVPAALLRDVAVDADHLALLQAVGFSSAIIVPLVLGPRPIGAMTWVSAESRRLYGPEDVALAVELAARVAVAIGNARVHADRVEIATVLQRALLPTVLPAAAGWSFASEYRAAGDANEVGGDFYDVQLLGDGAVLALVGDVAGKGARAAALTARTRHTLVTAAQLDGGELGAGLTLLNAQLQAEDDFELCSVVVLVARGAELTITSAGHPLPLLIRGGAVREQGATSPILGAAPPGTTWTAVTVTLLDGDLVVLHTDGVTDAVGAEDRFGDARLRAALLDGPAEAQAAIDRVVVAVDAFERGSQADDRALLALRWATPDR